MNALPRTGLGHLRIVEVFLRFDGPRLFAAVNESGQRYLAVFVDEDDDAEVFLYAPVSEERYGAIRSGALPLRNAFGDPQDGRVYVVTASTQGTGQAIEERRPEELEQDWLPDEDATLGLPTTTLPRFDPAELHTRAEAVGRTVVAIRLEAASIRSEYPLRPLGEVLQLFQDNIDAFAQEVAGKATAAGPVQGEIVQDVELAFAGAAAASFVVYVTSRAEAQLFEAPLLRRTFDLIVRVVEAGASPDALRDELGELHLRAIGRYRDLLEELEDVGSGLGVYVATPHEPLVRASLTREQVVENLHVVRESQQAPSEELTVVGQLVGVNTRTRVFEIQDDETGERYSGKAIEQARGEIYGLTTGERYRAVILREIELSGLTGEPKFKHRLRQIEPFEPVGGQLSAPTE